MLICTGSAVVGRAAWVKIIAHGCVQPSLNEFIHAKRRLAMLGRHHEEYAGKDGFLVSEARSRDWC